MGGVTDCCACGDIVDDKKQKTREIEIRPETPEIPLQDTVTSISLGIDSSFELEKKREEKLALNKGVKLQAKMADMGLLGKD